jgi:hypothetical protein
MARGANDQIGGKWIGEPRATGVRGSLLNMRLAPQSQAAFPVAEVFQAEQRRASLPWPAVSVT